MARRFPDAALLALFAFRHYAYQFWPAGQWGIVYGMAGACCLLATVAGGVALVAANAAFA